QGVEHNAQRLPNCDQPAECGFDRIGYLRQAVLVFRQRDSLVHQLVEQRQQLNGKLPPQSVPSTVKLDDFGLESLRRAPRLLVERNTELFSLLLQIFNAFTALLE